MAGKTLTTASRLQCPHGGTVQILSSHPAAAACGHPIATVGDTFLIVGCPFLLPPAIPSPCLTVKWLVSDRVGTVRGSATLSEGSAGMCMSAAQLPQGAVIVQQTQSVLGTL